MIGGNFNIRKWLRIRLAWRNSNKRVSLSFKRRGLWWLLFVSAWSLLVVRPTDWLLQLPGAVLLIGRAPFVYWGVSNYCALTEVFLLPRIQLCSLHRLSWLLLSYDYRHDYFLVSSMLKLSSLNPSKYTRWILASIGRLVTVTHNKNSNPKFPNLFFSRNYKSFRIFRGFEHFPSSIDWRVMAERVQDDTSSFVVPKGLDEFLVI